jgi:hypothetical protein
MAYAGSALTSMAKIKEQIMLTGGVFTSLAMSLNLFGDFVANKTSTNGIFSIIEDLQSVTANSVVMHAVFCYGWWDSPNNPDDGFWLCKNRCVGNAHVQCTNAAVGCRCTLHATPAQHAEKW